MKHVYATIKAQAVSEPTLILSAMLAACHESGLAVLRYTDHHFHPHGFSAAIILAESHFTCHTFPETWTVMVDIFCCNPKRLPMDTLELFRKKIDGVFLASEEVERDAG